jgi:hypothetical protein
MAVAERKFGIWGRSFEAERNYTPTSFANKNIYVGDKSCLLGQQP